MAACIIAKALVSPLLLVPSGLYDGAMKVVNIRVKGNNENGDGDEIGCCIG